MNKPFDIIVISAHPDDAEFGAAGTIAKWTGNGRNVIYVVCTKGDKGTANREIKSDQLAMIREEEQKAAAEIIGVKNVVFLGYPDQELEDTPEFRKQLVREIRKHRPYTVMTLDPYRRYIWHRDHRIVGQVVLDAVYPYARDHLAYPDLIDEGLEPHKVREVFLWGSDEINYRSDITAIFDKKLAALLCHKSQMNEKRPDEIKTWLRNHCREMAEGEDFELAEGFHRVEVPG